MRHALILLALLAPGAAISKADAPRSLAIYPRQQIPLRFDHEQHLALDMKCISCHDVDVSHRSSERNIPGHPTCETCHDIEAARAGEETDPPSACAVCHPGFDASARQQPEALVFPPPGIKFDHAVHLERRIACDVCHGDLTKVHLATRAQLPKMETCLTCHAEGRAASGACATCHLTQPSGRLAQVLPGGARLIPEIGNPFGVAHGMNYEREHSLDAQARRGVCAECHGESECLVCHDGTFRNLRFHPNDWITLHPVPAKLSSLECTSCHRSQSFCATCHERVGLGENAPGPLTPRGQLMFHPAGWKEGSSPGGHGIWASRNINACVSCHREEDCLHCHATQGRAPEFGGNNPHPPGFRSQATGVCKANPRMCIKCHTREDPNLRDCL